MAKNISRFGQVASSLAGALVVLSACNAGIQASGTIKPVPASNGGDVAFTPAAGGSSLAFTLKLDAPAGQERLLSLPSDTASVDITITGAAFAGKTITATVKKSDFVNNTASITIDHLPLGSATVGVIIHDATGKELGRGSATATVEAGKTNPVHVLVQASPDTGALAIVVDSTPDVSGGGFAALPAIGNKRIDRLGIPSLVLVFYGYNGFSRGVLGDPAPQPPSTVPPPAVAPLDMVANLKAGKIADPTAKALQAGYDGMDLYNTQNPADDRAANAPHFAAALKAIFGRTDADANAIAQVLTPDVQTLDMSVATKFLTSGRALSDDVVDTELKVLSGVSAASDKIDANDKPFTTTFPYLARPW